MPGTFSLPQRVSVPDMHHSTCVTHVPWCMPGSLTTGFFWNRWRGNVPGIPGACATRNFTYLVRGLWLCDTLYCCGYVVSPKWIHVDRLSTFSGFRHRFGANLDILPCASPVTLNDMVTAEQCFTPYYGKMCFFRYLPAIFKMLQLNLIKNCW